MKADKELLELAAKAAGVAGEYRSYYVEAYNKDFFGIAVKGASSYSFWNPLTDSGDAFRLMVKLDMQVTVDIGCGEVWIAHNLLYPEIQESLEDTDVYAATRRAIVRAAATIGGGYMKANEHFNLPLSAGDHEVIAERVYQDLDYDHIAEFNTPEQAKIAARCINHADALADALESLVVECENFAANFKSEYYEALDAITTYRGAK